MNNSRVVEVGGECDCADAQDLLGKLSPLHPFWQPDPSRWIFRGQGRAHELFPKAYRKESDQFVEFGLSCPPNSDWDVLGKAHTKLQTRFHLALDRAGLGIPTRQPKVSHGAAQSSYSNEVAPEAYPLLALAQHLGLPTQLLDWSLHSRVATYFAAESAVRKKYDAAQRSRNGESNPASHEGESAVPENMVIWALNRDVVREEGGRNDGTSVVLMTAPRASNPNLHAQSGVFTWIRGGGAHLLPLDKHIEAMVADNPAHAESSGVAMPFMRRLTLPEAFAPTLLRLLSYEGVDGSSMFPGYDGVVKAMRERARWDIPPEDDR